MAMSISRANLTVLLILCGLVATGISLGATNDSPVLGADMPLLPALVRTARITGKVEIQVVTGADGKVVSAQLKNGHPLLARAALDNVKTWRFAGASERTITCEFKIEEREANVFDDYYRYGKIIFQLPNSVVVVFPPLIVEPQN
jgi:TonB family protein